MIEIAGSKYYFDVEKICQYINYSDKTDVKELEILDTYEEGKNVGKTVRELTTPGNAQIDNIKYDLIKTLLIQIITYEGEVVALEDIPFGTKLAFNTLIQEGFLVEVNE